VLWLALGARTREKQIMPGGKIAKLCIRAPNGAVWVGQNAPLRNH